MVLCDGLVLLLWRSASLSAYRARFARVAEGRWWEAPRAHDKTNPVDVATSDMLNYSSNFRGDWQTSVKPYRAGDIVRETVT